jgi:uncharacterized protein YndB with AHSA1/START domain
MTRVYDAPRDLVFRAWTDARHIAKWWGPKGFTNVVRAWDARKDGAIDLDMIAPDGTGHPMGGTIHEVSPPDRLVFTSTAFEDANGEPQLENLNTITFEDLGGKTRVTVHVAVLRASPAMEAGPLAGMEQGWNQSLNRLGDLVSKNGRKQCV